jgi:hypothetical protein
VSRQVLETALQTHLSAKNNALSQKQRAGKQCTIS